MVIDKEKYEFMVVVELDDEKILSDEKYDLDDVYRVVKKVLVEEGMVDVSEGNRLIFATRRGGSQGFGSVGAAIMILWRSWTKKYLKTMEWHNLNNGTMEDSLSILKESEKRHGG